MKLNLVFSIPKLSLVGTFAALLVSTLAACSQGSGGGASERQVNVNEPTGSGSFSYSGPAPASDEIQNFKLSFYDPLVEDNRCGECHTPGKTGTPAFVDQSNVNQAWQAARSVVNLDDPSSSSVVTRVANGHNCWLAPGQDAACAATVQGYVERWAESEQSSISTVQLTPRRAYAPGATRVLPPSYSDVLDLGLDLNASGELMELLTRYCSDCHSDSAAIPQVPYLASGDIDIAYAALRGTVDLVSPARSRLVQRMSPDSHNCWSDCDSNAQTLQSAISMLSDAVPPTQVNSQLITSTAQVLAEDGVEANTGGRVEGDVVAKWEFREGSGTVTADTSGVQPEIPLTLSGEYSWLSGWGVRFTNGKAQGGANASAKLFERISGSGEYSIEAWVAPANVTQEEAWIVGYAGGPQSRNFLVSQSLYNYLAYTRSSVTDDNNGGEPPLSTGDNAELAQATLQHVVVTFDPVRGRRIYVNGQFSGDDDPIGGGLLNSWNESFAVVLGNTTSGANPWAGALRLVAIHNRALSQEQIEQNYDVGVGQKFFLMFSVSELLDREGLCHVMSGQERTNYCYVVFEVSQFDEASYLFNKPFFVNINPDGGTVDFNLAGVRLGINGKLAEVGQAFVNVDAQVNTAASGVLQTLSPAGTVIALENGADQDVFFLSFDAVEGSIGDGESRRRQSFFHINSGVSAPEVGMRTFDEINASLSALTGVPVASSDVSQVTGKTVGETFALVRRALPSVADFNAYSASHQMAATQLAAAYCDALVQDVALREQLFPAPPTFNFSAPVADASIEWRAHVAAPLIDRAINSGLFSESVRNAMLDEIELLITDDRDLKPYINVNGSWISDPNPAAHTKRDGLIYCENNAVCPASRTADVVKAACTAVFGSAVVLLK
ncbi:MAG: LamG domain-containing protein [Halioglobus sp.]